MINTCVLTGRITKDIELRATQNGVSNVSFSIAVQRNFKDEQGNYQSDFISCVAWRGQADFLAKYCLKGDLIGITGKLQTRQWQDQSGRTNYITEVIVDSVECYTKHEQQQNTTPKQKNNNGVKVNGKQYNPTDDESWEQPF